MFFCIAATDELDSSTLPLNPEESQHSRSGKVVLRSLVQVEPGQAGVTCYFSPDKWGEESNALLLGDHHFRDLLLEYSSVEQVVAQASRTGSNDLRSPVSAVAKYARTVDDVCNVLRSWGENALSSRIAYFASGEDSSDGDIPVTPESARGFLAFFGGVKSDGRISLTCSQEGWICAEWLFPDQRGVSLWFLDDDRVMFAATDASGNFVEIDGGVEVGSRAVVTAKLVEAGLFIWSLGRLTGTSFCTAITFSDIVDRTTSMNLVSRPLTPSSFVMERLTYPPTGWNTFIPQTDQSKFRELVRL